MNVIVVDIDGTLVHDNVFPYLTVCRFVQEVYDKTQLPMVVVTGRYYNEPRGGLADTKALVRDFLARPVKEIIMRTDDEERSLPDFKVGEVTKRGYVPRYVFEDDLNNLAAFAGRWPDAELYQVEGGQVRPVRRMEALLLELRRAVS